MSQCRFHFDFEGSGESLVEKIRARLAGAGGTLTGSAEEGAFSLSTPVGQFRGTYRVEVRTIVLEVSDKPFFVSCGAIEATLSQYVKGALDRPSSKR
jgi:hypothetical protein